MLPEQLKSQIEKDCADDIESSAIYRGDVKFYVRKDRLIELCRYLRDNQNLGFNFLSMITAADYLDKREKRFEIIYSLYSIPYHHRVMLKIRISENEEVPSLTCLWDTADWQEREVYDMFGIKFTGHPNLRRILMDDDWVGYPQRKDFPLTYELPEFSHNRGNVQIRPTNPERN
ncbi:MAG: NADH-quinone oxidoreductase subunit C [candidate division Zixibacteria bacterium]|jgi:NADH-quinone oxidoreductase subunit C|nr:NADH-quinone oxidoreductase subunit C [candidate division Zixibacteria bacterium]